MESEEVMGYTGLLNGGAVVLPNGNGLEKEYIENGKVRVGIDEEEKGEIADELLEDFEEYWDDINDRLLVSRMVSDSVIKGMVTAVEQEATERITAKELEVAHLKEYLLSREVGTGECDVKLSVGVKSFEMGKNCITDFGVNHGKMREDLLALRKLTCEQFDKAKREVECAKRGTSMKKVGSGSELVGLGGILKENSWVHVDGMLESLNAAVNFVCSKMEDILLSSEASLCESQQDLDLLAQLEGMVIPSVILGLKGENFLDPNVQLHGIQTVNWLEKFNVISGLGNHLEAIQKSLSAHETALVSHGSQDLDHLHHKAFGNHITPPTSLCGENGTLDESIIHVAESYDYQQLKHMTKEELVDYFNNIITKLKRDHESVLERKTEKYFSLKREYLNLKERGSPVTHRKDEEFDVLRKKIQEIISKLEIFLMENERFPALLHNFENLEKLKLRLDCLHLENNQLRNTLIDRESEMNRLKSQISSAAEELLRCSSAEENMLKLVGKLKSDMDDSLIETSLTEEVCKSVLREQIAQTMCDSEDFSMEFLMAHEICDIIIREAVAIPAETANSYEIEDSNIELCIMQELSGLIFTEVVKDAVILIKDLRKEAIIDKQVKICWETEAHEMEHALGLRVEENMKLKQDIQELRTALQDKEKLAMDLSFSMVKKREEFELASRELSSLRENAKHLEALVTKSNRDLEIFKCQYLEVVKQIEVNKIEVHKLQQELDQTKEVLTQTNKRALTLSQEKHDNLLLSELREGKLKKEMELAVSNVSNLFGKFEWRISGVISQNSIRLDDSSSHLKSLSDMANDLRRREEMYKQKLDLQSANLQKAEAEVDLLGDEVDTLLRLLNKIYIALDHYSPVLKHYPGIKEILELVRRALSGGSTVLL